MSPRAAAIPLSIRPFDRERDLAGVLDLVGGARSRRDAGSMFHPGGLQWWLRRLGLSSFDVAVLANDDSVAGLALRDSSDALVQVEPARSDELAGLLAWAEEGARAAKESELFLSVFEDDDGLRRAARSRGYAPSDRHGYELVYDLADEPERPTLPDGFTMLSLTPALADRYVELHRAAWARPGKPSTFDRGQLDTVTRMPDFRYDLVPIVSAPDGTLAAYCICWWDPRSASVEIEPLGTHPDLRRLGLARAIVHEVLRRSRALHAKEVLVWGISTNPEAKALYESAGMTARRLLRDHRLALGPAER